MTDVKLPVRKILKNLLLLREVFTSYRCHKHEDVYLENKLKISSTVKVRYYHYGNGEIEVKAA